MLNGQTPTFRRDEPATSATHTTAMGRGGGGGEGMKKGKGGVKGERITTELDDKDHPEVRF